MYENLLAVTNRHLSPRPFLEQIERLAQSDIAGIILREKDMSEADYEMLAREVLAICARYDKPCTLHTFVDVARRLNCPRIHLPLPRLMEYAAGDGGESASASASGTAKCGRLAGFTTIGTSVHAAEEVAIAERCGATYLTGGHIYATDCKRGLPGRGLDFLRAVTEVATVPIYAIGGITRANLAQVLSAGAAGGCIMSLSMRL